MNYQEFRGLWHDALQAARLQIPQTIGPTERINLRDMSRSYELVLFSSLHSKCEPFHLVTTIQWDWDTTLSARYATTEEDLLMEIFGDFGVYDNDTVLPQLRMDVCLSASIPFGSIYPLPPLTQWQFWVRQAGGDLQAFLPTVYESDESICAYSGPIEATVKILGDGNFSLERVSFKAWQAIKLPRQWDDPEKRDPYPDDMLLDLAKRIAKAIGVLENSLARLVKGSEDHASCEN